MRIEIFRETSGVAVSTALKKRAARSESERMSHAKRRSPPEPEAIAATPDQIREAYLALTKTELARLASFARWRFQALGRRRQARDPDELVTDAFLAILDATRTWYPAKAAFFVALIGAWLDPGEDAAGHQAWVQSLWEQVRHEGAGVYVNFLEEDEGKERILDAYPSATFARLADIKRRYDPRNVFKFNQNIRPDRIPGVGQ